MRDYRRRGALDLFVSKGIQAPKKVNRQEAKDAKKRQRKRNTSLTPRRKDRKEKATWEEEE